MATDKTLFKISFYNQEALYEIYAEELAQSSMYGFIEVGKIVFNQKSSVVLDPTEERLKKEFENVQRTYIPVQEIVRIDEVSKQGVAKIIDIEGNKSNVHQFPTSAFAPVSVKD